MRIFSPAVVAKMIFKMVTGIKGSRQVVAATEKVTCCSRLKNIVPHSRFMVLPIIKDNIKSVLWRGHCLVPRPISQVITGKDQRKPPVGPMRHCRPPVKLEKTGRPMAPKSIYTTMAIVPLRGPKRIPANMTAKVCIVMGTPRGIGMDICAMITRMDVIVPMRQRS